MQQISIIVPYFNSEDTIKRCVESILNQDYFNYEILIIDDGSSEKSYIQLISILKSFSSSKIKLIRFEVNKGVSFARNVGINLSKSNLIAFIDSDDSWHSNHLSSQVNLILESKADLVCSGYTHFEKFNNNAIGPIKAKRLFLSDFLFKNPIKTPTVVARKQSILKFPEHLRRCEDFYLWVLLVSHGKILISSNRTLAFGYKNEIGESGLTSSYQIMHKSFLNSIFYLHKNRIIKTHIYYLLYFIEFIKYPIRIFRIKCKINIR